MSGTEITAFLKQGTQTAKVSTVSKNGTCHMAPVWYIVDGDDIVFSTGKETTKGKHLLRDNRLTICVDDQTPPYSFVTVNGNAELAELQPSELLKWTTRIAERYMGKDNAERYGKRNAVEGEMLVRVKPVKIIAKKNISDF